MSHHTRGRKSAASAPVDAICSVPAPPRWLSKEAKAEWRRVMPVLVERRVLSPADLNAAEMYCSAVGEAAIARAAIAKDGAYLPNARGELKRHPAFTTLREMTSEARRWAAELGVTPASRGRIAEGGADDDADSDLGLG